MTRRKQPSKRAREMAARYCDAMAAWWNDVGAYPDWIDFPTSETSRSLGWWVRWAVPHPARPTPAFAWAEAAAWLRSGERLP